MIEKLRLYHYRNFENYVLPLDHQHVVLYGRNGAGKTNILEAVSLFSIGKGLKKSAPQEIERNQTGETGWAVHLTLADDVHLKTSFEKQLDGTFKRLSKAQEHPIKNHTELSQWVNILWITPETDRLFLDSPSNRRKFVDRFVYAQDVFHLKRVVRYEQAVKDRLKILKTYGVCQDAWLDALEKTIAQEGLAIAKSRQLLLDKLSMFTPHSDEVSLLPGFKACMKSPFEDLLSAPEYMQESLFLEQLRANRVVDKESGMTRFGPHRSDLHVFHMIKKIDVFQCSTGEQKILLLALLIAFIEQFCLNTDYLTVFLLDDVIAHLDEPHRFVLFKRLLAHYKSPFQAWFSGTDAHFFTPLKNDANFINIE
ncbi:MAG: DNA replication and repair protein RecF [Holosporales bacterium]